MKSATKRAMKGLDRGVLRGCAATAVILLAVVAWPSEGWSRTRIQVCEVGHVQQLLDNWAKKLAASSPKHPEPIVETYAPDMPGPRAVLLPTCANGPSIGRVAIEEYFAEHFLPSSPVVQGGFVHPTIDGDCSVAYASGLYTFKLKVDNMTKTVYARYTFVFRHGLITQHHSSLEPKPRQGEPRSECPSH